MTFKAAFEMLAVSAMVVIAGYIGTEFKAMSQSVQTLNTTVAVLVAQYADARARSDKYEASLDGLDSRLRAVEANRRR